MAGLILRLLSDQPYRVEVDGDECRHFDGNCRSGARQSGRRNR